MNIDKNNTVMCELSGKSFFTEISKDISLPDYQPEIKRLIKITANVLPPKMDFGMDDTVFSGDIDYYVLYLGSDNQMYCAPVSDEYSVNMPLDTREMADSYSCFADITCETVNGRVTAPRNLTVRAKLKANARIFSSLSVNDTFSDGTCDESIKKLCGEVNSCQVDRVVSEPVRVTDEVILDTREGDVRVICADGRVMLSEVKGNNNEAYLRGDTYIKILACKEDNGAPYVIQRKLPIFASIPLRFADASASLYAKGCVSELSVIVDEGRISLDVGVVFDCMSLKNTPVTYVKDMYSTVCLTRCDYKKYKVVSESGGAFCNITSSETRTLDELMIVPESKIADVSGVSRIDSVERDGSRMKASGTVRYGIALEVGGEYSLKEVDLPFSYTCESGENWDNIFPSSEVVSTRGRIDGERISLDCEIALMFKAYCENEISALEAMHFGETVEQKNCTVVVFPSSDDTVWSIAKKYNAPTERVISSNPVLSRSSDTLSLDDAGALSGVHHIII